VAPKTVLTQIVCGDTKQSFVDGAANEARLGECLEQFAEQRNDREVQHEL
jgi:hypothetical protein